jgi:hypothetical protein
MALISTAVSWCCQLVSPNMRACYDLLPRPSAGCYCGTYGEAWGRGPGSLAGGIADDGLIDVASANEAAVGD